MIAKKQHFLDVLLFLPLLAAADCGPPETVDPECDMPGEPPTLEDVDNGFGQAKQDGDKFREAGTWSGGQNASIDIGTLAMIFVKDELGYDVPDLIGRRAFPICIRLGERGDKKGSAQLTDNPDMLTDKDHTGQISILDEQDSFLVGRFGVTLSDGTDTTTFKSGVFRIPKFKDPE